MGIYSETTPNTPRDTTFEDVQMVDEIIVDPLAEYIDKQHYLSSIFEDKNYREVNIDYIKIDKEFVPCLCMDYITVNRFCKNMTQLGYDTTVFLAHKRRYRMVVINNEHPFDLFHVFRHLEVFK